MEHRPHGVGGLLKENVRPTATSASEPRGAKNKVRIARWYCLTCSQSRQRMGNEAGHSFYARLRRELIRKMQTTVSGSTAKQAVVVDRDVADDIAEKLSGLM